MAQEVSERLKNMGELKINSAEEKIRAGWGGIVVRLMTRPLAFLPLPVLSGVCAALGRLTFLLWPGRRKIALDNLDRAVWRGDLYLRQSPRQTASNCFANLGRAGAEGLKLFHRLDDSLMKSVRIEGAENLRQAKAKDKGVIMITGHCGNWELLGVALAVLMGESFSVVAREQNSALLNGIVESMRNRGGNRVIYKQGAVRKLMAELRARKGVGILVDQAVLESEGIVVDFFGMPALTTKLPALIARKTGAPVLPCFIHREADAGEHVITIHPSPVLSSDPDPDKAVLEDTALFTSYVEDYVRTYPDQWLWGHRRWKRAARVPSEAP